MSKEPIKFKGIDDWNRPVFQSMKYARNFFGSTDKLFSYGATEAEVLEKVTVDDLCFFGSTFNCEPLGYRTKGTLEIVKGGE